MALQTSVRRRNNCAQPERSAARVRRRRRVGVESLDRPRQRIALDEPHGIVGPTEAVGAQAVDRDDARVLQPTGDLGLQEEPPPAIGVVGVPVEDLLERHLAVELGVQRHEDGAEAALGMGPEDAESLAVGGGGADGGAGRAVGVTVGPVQC